MRIKYRGLSKTQATQALKDRIKEPRALTLEEQNYIQGFFETFYPEHWKYKTNDGEGELIAIEIRNHPIFHTPGYWLIFSNLPDTAISIKGSKSPFSDVIAACREAIYPEVEEFKAKELLKQPVCPFSGQLLTKDNSDVDHYNLSFSEAANKWISEAGGPLLLYEHIDHNAIRPVFHNENIKQQWIHFHNQHCHLRLISTVANQGLLRDPYISKYLPNINNQ